MPAWTFLPSLLFPLVVHASPTGAGADEVEAFPTAAAEGADRLCVAGHQTNLRQTPSTSGRVIDQLALGTTVMVRAVVPGGPVEIGPRKDWWYQVAVLDDTGNPVGKGYLYGGTLTRTCIHVDLDGDGEAERATVSINPQGTPVVRVLEPGGSHQTTASLPITRAGNQPLLQARVGLIPAGAAGFSMVRVEVYGHTPAERAYGRAFYVSYAAPRPGVQGTATLALQHPADGEANGTSWQTRMAFDAVSRTASLTTVTTAADGQQTRKVQYYKASHASYIEVPAP